MPTFRTAVTSEILSERRGLQRLSVTMSDGSRAKAYVLTELTGRCDPGDEVIVNTTAVELGLGTGGWHFVHWNNNRREFVAHGPDHIMKLRYTSLQFDAGTDELDHPECDQPLDGVPVVVCSVHSQLGAVVAAFRAMAPDRRLVHVMTDGAALPLALSDLVADLRARGLLAGTVTAGHAFGGDLEAVTTPAAIGLAVHTMGADAVVVAMGPGVVGTGTSLGTTAVEVAPILDAVDLAGGVPILCVRASQADPRPRHHGISHHTVTALGLTRSRPLVATVPAEVASLDGVRAVSWRKPDAGGLLESAGLHLTTMGRTVDEDPVFFESACAAGQIAAMVALQGEPAVLAMAASTDGNTSTGNGRSTIDRTRPDGGRS